MLFIFLKLLCCLFALVGDMTGNIFNGTEKLISRKFEIVKIYDEFIVPGMKSQQNFWCACAYKLVKLIESKADYSICYRLPQCLVS